jgi:hypothetical protein
MMCIVGRAMRENREENGWAKCECLEGFVEANPIQQYCVPKYCAVYSQYCPKCT